MKKIIISILLLLSLTSCIGQDINKQNQINKKKGDYTMLYTILINKDTQKMSENVFFKNNISIDTDNYVYLKSIDDFNNLDNIDGLQEGKIIIFVIDEKNYLNKDGITKINKEEYSLLADDLTTGFIILGEITEIDTPYLFKSPNSIKGKKYNGFFIELI